MALRSPTIHHSYWGSFADAASLPVGDARLQAGDTAYAQAEASLYVYDGAVWQAVSGGGGGITALTQDVVASGTGSVAATVQGMGGASSKTHFVIEGGKFATLQAAVNAASANDVIMVGPKATGDWGNVTLNVVNKPLIIAAMAGAGANKVVKVGSLTYDLGTTGPALNVNLNEVYVYGLQIQGAFAGGSAVTLTGGANYPGRLRLYGCYVLNTSATGTATVTNSNQGANSSLYIDSSIVAMEGSTTGHTIVQTAGYTVLRNRTDVSGSAAVGATGNALRVSGGTFEIYDSYVSITRASGATLSITGGSTYVSAAYSTILNTSNAAGSSVVSIGTAGAVFAAGDASLTLGTNPGPAAGAVVTGVAGGLFAYGHITYSFSTTISTVTAIPAAQEVATGDLSGNYPNPTVAKIQGRAVATTAPTISQVLTWNGSAWAPATPTSGVTSVTASAPLASSGGATPNVSLTGTVAVANGGTGNSASPSNGQLLLGNGSGYTLGTLTAGAGITITNAAGSVTVAANAAAPQSLPLDGTASGGTPATIGTIYVPAPRTLTAGALAYFGGSLAGDTTSLTLVPAGGGPAAATWTRTGLLGSQALTSGGSLAIGWYDLILTPGASGTAFARGLYLV